VSKSKKKQAARKRATEGGLVPDGPQVVEAYLAAPDEAAGDDAPDAEFDEFDDGPSLALPTKQAQPLNEALYEKALAAVTGHGVMRDEGDALSYLYNGDTLSMKFTEGAEGTGDPDRLMIAAFRKGVVFQTEGETQVVYQPGDWEAEITRLAGMPAAEPDDEPEGEA
jgi:hypothetical protein